MRNEIKELHIMLWITTILCFFFALSTMYLSDRLAYIENKCTEVRK